MILLATIQIVQVRKRFGDVKASVGGGMVRRVYRSRHHRRYWHRIAAHYTKTLRAVALIDLAYGITPVQTSVYKEIS